MLFANKKEEVLDVELTPHGRYLLSLGRLKPVYYSFHDSNILYDGRYAEILEYTKSIEDRIQHNTPQPKTLNSRVSREKNVKKIFTTNLNLASSVDKATELASIAQLNEQKAFLATDPIGSCSPTTNLAPKWSIKVLNGEISGSIPYLTSSYQTLRIPQIDIDVVYKTAILDVSDDSYVLPLRPDPALSSRVFEDGTYVAIDPDHLLLEILEENTEYNKTNFEIEVFEVEDEDYVSAKSGISGAGVSQEELKSLFFNRPPQNIVDNILIDDQAVATQEPILDNDAMVDYYFNVFVDEEIDPADLCEAKETFEKKNIFIDLDITCAPDEATPTRYNVYTGPEPLAPCPVPDTGTDCND